MPALTIDQNVLLPLRLAGCRPEPGLVEEMLERTVLAERWVPVGPTRAARLSIGHGRCCAAIRYPYGMASTGFDEPERAR